MSVDQSEFTQAILDPAMAVPAGLSDPEGRPAGRRFAVYRNNVAVSLTEALQTGFPVVRKLVGDEFFQAMSGVYLRQHPPKSPLMMFYGAEMPDFLAAFEPVAHLGYLPDVARLELALRQSYHAANVDPIDPQTLQTIPTERLMAARLTLAPSVRLIRSKWPIYAIWLANTQPDAPKSEMGPKDVLITRPQFDPAPAELGIGGGAFVEAIGKGEIFADALEQAGPEFDLTAMLSVLLAGGAITKISEGTDR